MSVLALILTLAVTLGGECGPVRQACEVEIARTIANRYVQCHDLPTVLAAYHARGTPTPAGLVAAAALVRCPSCLADGLYYFAYSDQDRAEMGWPAGDLVLCGGGLCVNLSHDYPGGER